MRIVDFSGGLNLDVIERMLPSEETLSGVDSAVGSIVSAVRDRGDEAVCEFTARFDSFRLTPATMRVSEEEIRGYAAQADPGLVAILRRSAKNIRNFHQQQIEDSWEMYAGDGVRLGQRITPIERVGLYVPGGKAAYPSSVLMNAIPAQVAGVEQIVVVTPPRSLEENPLVAAAFDLLGVHEVYRIGGAQAIAALAYGTATVPGVSKIAGPGNVYVQAAKRAVLGRVDIDMIAGPSEVAIIADVSCNPSWIAADLLAQAEHDETAGVWLVCWSGDLAAAVFDQVQVQLNTLERAPIARKAAEDNGMIFVVAGPNDAVALVNAIAPEHVEILMKAPATVADGIRNAGALFIGRHSPAVVGDYFAGPNHVLPTGRAARFRSPLGVQDFLKRTSVVRYSARALERFGDMIEQFAIAEGLTGHARSISIRRD